MDYRSRCKVKRKIGNSVINTYKGMLKSYNSTIFHRFGQFYHYIGRYCYRLKYMNVNFAPYILTLTYHETKPSYITPAMLAVRHSVSPHARARKPMKPPTAPVKEVAFTKVHIDDSFWTPA